MFRRLIAWLFGREQTAPPSPEITRRERDQRRDTKRSNVRQARRKAARWRGEVEYGGHNKSYEESRRCAA